MRMKTQQLFEANDLRRLNLSNLFSLWESVGTVNGALENHRGFEKIYHHGSSWPNRIWLTGEEGEEHTRAALENAASYLTREDEPILLVLTEEQLAFSRDWLRKRGLSLLFSQTGMVLELEGASAVPKEDPLEIITVGTQEESSLWSQVASEAFGYRVDPTVVRNVVDVSEITLYLGFLPEGVAGTALLCTHCGVAGFHMAGTRPELRRRGVARRMMRHLMGEARAKGLRYATLQASAMGEPLYDELGFGKQFLLHNYLFSIG
jgi:ribosomal protein S18 acetylase RimI-like enzyme